MIGPSVLLIEDDPLSRKAMRVALEAGGFTVIEAASGQEALELSTLSPDVIVQDLRLPDMDGLELAERLKVERRSPMIAVSGVDSSLEEARALGASFSRFLVKPVKPRALVDAVRSLLPDQARPLQRPGFDADFLVQRVLLVFDKGKRSRHIMLHLHHAGFEVTIAPQPERALELARSLDPHAVVFDAEKVSVDGFRLIKQFKDDPNLGTTPRLLISTFIFDKDRTQSPWQNLVTEAVHFDRDASELIDALKGLSNPNPPPRSRVATAEMTPDDYLLRLQRELEHLSRQNAALTRACALQESQLAVLAGVAEVMTRSNDIERLLDEVLARYMDIEPFTHGAAFLISPSGELILKAHRGFDPHQIDQASVFFGSDALLKVALRRDLPSCLPTVHSDEDSTSALLTGAFRSLLVIPLLTAQQRLGALILASTIGDVRKAGMASAHLIQGQISHAIALGQMLARLTASEQRFRAIADHAAEGLLVTDRSGRISYLNLTASHMIQCSIDAALGQPMDLFLSNIPTTSERDSSNNLPKTWEAQTLRANGNPLTLRISTSHLDLGQRTHILIDVTERKRLQDKLIQEARHDPLTGLLNRRAFEDALTQNLILSRARNTSGALLYIDLDHLKRVNDTLGHQAGDAVLVATAEIFKKRLRQSDFAARLGGDEFAILCPGADTPQALTLAAELLDLILALPILDRPELAVSASIGVALFPSHGRSMHQLMAHADRAMYLAKTTGRAKVCLFTLNMLHADSPLD